jgi:hypothetical protein
LFTAVHAGCHGKNPVTGWTLKGFLRACVSAFQKPVLIRVRLWRGGFFILRILFGFLWLVPGACCGWRFAHSRAPTDHRSMFA